VAGLKVAPERWQAIYMRRTNSNWYQGDAKEPLSLGSDVEEQKSVGKESVAKTQARYAWRIML